MRRKRHTQEQTVATLLNERDGGQLGPHAQRRRRAGSSLEVGTRWHGGVRYEADRASSEKSLRLQRLGGGPGFGLCGCLRMSLKC